MAKKGLTVDVETFFLAVSLKCGPPLQRYFDYVHPLRGWKQQILRGIGVWVHNTDEGTKFMEVVTGFGEAKLRATHWYLKYARWYRKAKANYHQPAGVVDPRTVDVYTAKYSHDERERNSAKQTLQAANKLADAGQKGRRRLSVSSSE